ncbi:hypothetical protein V4C85_25665 [Ralstonia solanacearum]|uniref:hypothetical protein n=1 Tax=Ralstonia solanacearum TaxID=305 RepID=UPI0007C90EBB|nr:hypothetical protein [Ralstonia solanacearum]OAI70720.1 hypothetical protein RSP597_15895 [Ralstonia solanacearum]
MVNATVRYEIDDNESFEKNLDSFRRHLIELDPSLSDAISGVLQSMVYGSVEKVALWDALLAKVETDGSQK